MARPRRAVRTVRKEIALPEDLVAQVELTLFSSVESRVPYGSWAQVVEPLLRRALARRDREALALREAEVEGAPLEQVAAQLLREEGYTSFADLMETKQ